MGEKLWWAWITASASRATTTIPTPQKILNPSGLLQQQQSQDQLLLQVMGSQESNFAWQNESNAGWWSYQSNDTAANLTNFTNNFTAYDYSNGTSSQLLELTQEQYDLIVTLIVATVLGFLILATIIGRLLTFLMDQLDNFFLWASYGWKPFQIYNILLDFWLECWTETRFVIVKITI